ncbi:Spo11/DNA topoisomerase VI subunit A [Mycena haematopus]|nr:Spo11/DNA topoisomerase VI subunit A [Mycena haematopus]
MQGAAAVVGETQRAAAVVGRGCGAACSSSAVPLCFPSLDRAFNRSGCSCSRPRSSATPCIIEYRAADKVCPTLPEKALRMAQSDIPRSETLNPIESSASAEASMAAPESNERQYMAQQVHQTPFNVVAIDRLMELLSSLRREPRSLTVAVYDAPLVEHRGLMYSPAVKWVWPEHVEYIERMVQIIILVLEGLHSGVPFAKRFFFYRLHRGGLFKEQQESDRYLQRLVASVGLPLRHLNITSSSTGSFRAPPNTVTLVFHNGKRIRNIDAPMAIPEEIDLQAIQVDKTVRWVLIIEKNTIFSPLSSRRIIEDMKNFGALGMILTGRGMPSYSTRHFVKILNDSCPHVVLIGLVDGDIGGVSIINTYRNSSGVASTENLASPRMQWVGLYPWEYPSTRGEKLSPVDVHRLEELIRMSDAYIPRSWKHAMRAMLRWGAKLGLEIPPLERAIQIASGRIRRALTVGVAALQIETFDLDDDGNNPPPPPQPLQWHRERRLGLTG